MQKSDSDAAGAAMTNSSDAETGQLPGEARIVGRHVTKRTVLNRCLAFLGGGAAMTLLCIVAFAFFGDLSRQLNQWHFVWRWEDRIRSHVELFAAGLFCTGGVAGMLLPEIRLPKWTVAIVLGSLVGALSTLFVLNVLDFFLGETAVARVYQDFKDESNHVRNATKRPEPGQKFYPSCYRSKFWIRGWLYGLSLGLIGGMAYVLPPKRQGAAMIVLTILATGMFAECYWTGNAAMKSWEAHQREFLERRER
jgi:hypothetical protein